MDGTRLQIRVHPRAKRNRLELLEDGKLKVYVTAAPERGKANNAAIELLAESLGVAKSSVRILHGGHSRDKLLTVEGLDASALGKLRPTGGRPPAG